MKNNNWLLKFFVVLCLLSTCSSTVYADLYWEYEEVSSDNPKKLKIIKFYLSEYAYRVDDYNDMSSLTDFKTMTVYYLFNMYKIYSKMNMDQYSKMIGISGFAGRQMTKYTKVIPTNEKKIIANYNSKKYIIESDGKKSEYWLSEDIKGYNEYKKLTTKMKEIFKEYPILSQAGMGGEFDQKGFLVKAVSSEMLGVTTTLTLRRIEQKTFDRSLFKVPSNYKLRN